MDSIAIIHTPVWTWIILPILIFCARIIDVSIGTVRIMFISKSYRLPAAALGFIEVLLWLFAMTQILQHLTNPVMYLAFAGGFATGNFMGIALENKIAMGTAMIRVITRVEAFDLIQHLRKEGFTLTSLDAEGNTGPVKVLFTVVKKKFIPEVIELVKTYNPNAFYTIEDVNFVKQPLGTTAPGRQWFQELVGYKRK